MGIVIKDGTSVAVFFYTFIGIFGYATFAQDMSQLCPKNILEADYQGNGLIQVANIALLLAIMAAAPLVVLPSKDTIEELFYKEKGMNRKQNFLITLALIVLGCVFALFVPNIGDAMTIVGSSINPVMGFVLPVVFYWKTIPKLPLLSFQKVACILNVLLITMVSIMSLVNFF